jgi:hypothetical protein
MYTTSNHFPNYNLFIPNLVLFVNITNIQNQFKYICEELKSKQLINITHFNISQNQQNPNIYIVKLEASWYDNALSKAVQHRLNNNESCTLLCNYYNEKEQVIKNYISITKYIAKPKTKLIDYGLK